MTHDLRLSAAHPVGGQSAVEQLLYAAFDPGSGAVEYCSCGHLPALLRRASGAGAVERLPAGGMPVGLFDNPRMKVRRAEMREGDLLFLYTDGVTEAFCGSRRCRGATSATARSRPTSGRSPVRDSRTPGSVRGALSNGRPLYVADCLASKHICRAARRTVSLCRPFGE